MAMIRINLLPLEARRAESTPLPRLLVTLAGTALLAMMFFTALWLFLAAIPAQNNLKTTKETLLRQQQQLARQADQIEAKIKHYERRASAVKALNTARIQWAEQLDWICDQVPEDVWLSTVTVRAPANRSGRASESGPIIVMKAFCSGTDEARVANFLKTIQAHSQFARFYQSADWSTITRSETKTGEILGFTVSLVMKPVGAPSPTAGSKVSASAPSTAPGT